jgi:isopropylmalate/homocitrate/citramalate synthase
MSFTVKAEDRFVSGWNASSDVVGEFRLPKRAILNDLTLREGRQVEGLVMSLDALQQIAGEISDAGVPMIQLHHTRPHVEAIGALGLRIGTEVLTRSPTQTAPFTVEAQKDRIDFVLSHGLGLDLCFGTSDQLLLARQSIRGEEETIEKLREREISGAFECVAYTKAQGGVAGTNLQDFLRADFDYVRRYCRVLQEAGVDLITLDDFAAPAIPAVYRHVFRLLTEEFPDITFGVHVTNDFGLATALVLAAFEGGAEVLDVGVNGYGERAGHADLAEVAVALEVFYGVDSGVDLQGLKRLSEKIAEIQGLPVISTKPLVGANAFADVTDTHYIYEDHPWIFRSIAPEMVGNRRRVALAGVSGLAVMRAKALELGIEISDGIAMEALGEVHDVLASKRGPISDEEISDILSRWVGK